VVSFRVKYLVPLINAWMSVEESDPSTHRELTPRRNGPHDRHEDAGIDDEVLSDQVEINIPHNFISGEQEECHRKCCANLVQDIHSAMDKHLSSATDHLKDISRSESSNSMEIYNGATIIFKNITVEIGRRKKKKAILSSITGYMDAGTLTALMGPSGSGKTSLVDVLTKRKNYGKITGTVMYDGISPDENYLKGKVAYVEQNDALIENLTVKETMLYSYDLIMGPCSLREDKMKVISNIIRQLDLERCESTYIGSSTQRGISGGQRKRVSIGISLIGTPNMLFMDEPTSGLDSHIALEVMGIVKELTWKGLTTVVSIHSPSSSIFSLFDKLIILSDGRLMYFGKADEYAISYFQNAGFKRISQSHRQNGADWLISIVAHASGLKGAEKIAACYDNSQLRAENENHLDHLCRIFKDNDKRSPHGSSEMPWLQSLMVKSGVWSTWCILKHRMLADYRLPSYIVPRIGVKSLFTFVMLTLFWGVGKELPESASYEEELARPMSITTSLFMWALLPVFVSVSVIPVLFHERDSFFREKKAGYYNAGSYLLAKMLQEWALDICVSAIFSCSLWFALQFTGSWLLFFLSYFTISVVGSLLAYLFASIAPSTEFAIIFCSGINIVLLFFVGLLIRWQDIPDYWRWIVYINYIHYSWGALMKNQFTDEDMLEPFGIPILQYFNLENGASGWDYLGYLSIFVVVFFVMAYTVLRYTNYSKR